MLPKMTLRVALLATTGLCSQAFAQEQEITLEPIIVDSASYETESTDSYTTDLISVGEKATLSRRQVPQSTSVVTRSQIEDGGYNALEEALADVPGILILNNDIGRSSIFSRGFEFDYLYFDGLPAPVSSIYGTQPDLSNVDHIEVLKGPAGLFIGTGEPAGSINMRLKQANAVETTGYATLSGDSDGQVRGEVDVARALNTDGTLRGRFVAARGDGGSFVDDVENGVTSLYGTLAWDVAPNTQLSLSLSHLERDIVPFNGLPTQADGSLLWLDASTTTVLDWNDFSNNSDDAIFAAEHFMDNGARVKFSMRQSNQDADFLYGWSATPANASNMIGGISWLARDFDQDSLALDLHTEMPLDLGGWAGNLVVGVDSQSLDNTTLQARGFVVQPLDLTNWDGSAVARPDARFTTRADVSSDSQGLYSQLRLSPAQALTLIAGARASWYDSSVDSTNLINGQTQRDELDENGRITPFAGLTYDLNAAMTVYASYSEIFTPQTVLDEDDNLLDPVVGRQFEAGLKGTFASSLNYSAALFNLRQSNRAVLEPNGAFYVAEEEVTVRGLELELSGELGANWQFAGGYTYTDTEYTSGPTQGEDFSTITPKHMLNLTANYLIADGALTGWTVGGRFTAFSDFSSRGIEAPGYGIVDLRVAKLFDNGLNLRVGVDNVFDKDYYSRVGGPTLFNFRGAPRSVNASLSKTF